MQMNIWVYLPFAIFSGSAAVSGFLVLLLPETFQTRLPDSINDIKNQKKKLKCDQQNQHDFSTIQRN